MARDRFRWTRERYYRAHHLNRLLNRFQCLPEMPRLLERYYALRALHPQHDDPLKRLVCFRLDDKRRLDDGIPF